MKKQSACALFVLSNSVLASDLLWQLDGFDQPESVILDTNRQQLVVSNINGSAGDKDGNGYLSLLSIDGRLLAKNWVGGMDAPKGMAIVQGQLLVADIDKVHVVDLEKGILESTIEVPSAVFLNDISAGDKVAYISDLMQQSIYRYQDGQIHQWLQSSKLQHPNGLLVDQDSLLVASWGAGLHDDFSTDVLGSVWRVDLQDQSISPVLGAERLGNLDGIAKTRSGYVLNDWITGELFTLDNSGALLRQEPTKPSLADISVSDDLMFMPFMTQGIVEVRSLAID